MAVFLLRHADGDPHRKQQRQVVKHRTAGFAHNIQQRIQNAAFGDDVLQVIGFDGGGIGKGTADSKQQTCNGQQGYGQHKGSPHPL